MPDFYAYNAACETCGHIARKGIGLQDTVFCAGCWATRRSSLGRRWNRAKNHEDQVHNDDLRARVPERLR